MKFILKVKFKKVTIQVQTHPLSCDYYLYVNHHLMDQKSGSEPKLQQVWYLRDQNIQFYNGRSIFMSVIK